MSETKTKNQCPKKQKRNQQQRNVGKNRQESESKPKPKKGYKKATKTTPTAVQNNTYSLCNTPTSVATPPSPCATHLLQWQHHLLLLCKQHTYCCANNTY